MAIFTSSQCGQRGLCECAPVSTDRRTSYRIASTSFWYRYLSSAWSDKPLGTPLESTVNYERLPCRYSSRSKVSSVLAFHSLQYCWIDDSIFDKYLPHFSNLFRRWMGARQASSKIGGLLQILLHSVWSLILRGGHLSSLVALVLVARLRLGQMSWKWRHSMSPCSFFC